MAVIAKMETTHWPRAIKTKRMEEVENEEEKEEKEEREEKEGEKRPKHFRMRLADYCECKTSVVVWTALLVIHLGCLFSQGMVIDPTPSIVRGISKKNPASVMVAYSKQRAFIHCLATNESIRFLGPPAKELKQLTNGVVTWGFSTWERRNPTLIALFELEKGKLKKTNIPCSKCVPYKEFGIEVTDVNSTDAGYYLLIYGSTASGHDPDNMAITSVNITGKQDLPVARSEKIGLCLQRDDDSFTLICGAVDSLGSPKIDLQLKTSGGKVLKSNFTGGMMATTIPVKEATDALGYVCEIDWDQPSSAECLSDEERKNWIATVPNPFYKEEESLLDTYIIPIVAVTTLVIGFAGGAFVMMLKSKMDVTTPNRRQSRHSRA